MNNKKKKIKIAFLLTPEIRNIDYNYTAGSERVLFSDAQELDKHFSLMSVCTSCEVMSLPIFLIKKFIRVHYPHRVVDVLDRLTFIFKEKNIAHVFFFIKRSAVVLFDLYYAVSFLLLERKTDVYYVINCPLVALLSPQKTLLTFQYFYSEYSYIFIWKKRVDQMTMIFPSNSLRDEYLHAYPNIHRSRCYVISNATDVAFFKNYNNRPGKITFSFASAWVREKGVMYIKYIVEELNKKYHNTINFLIGGSIYLWSMSQEQYKKMSTIEKQLVNISNKHSNVIIVGRIDRIDMPGFYNQSTYLLFPSIWKEPCALMVVESLACGTPVIAFSQGGTKEIVYNNVNGYIIKKIGKKYLLEELIRIIEAYNTNDYQRMSLCCQKSAEQYSIVARARAIMNLPLFKHRI